MTILVDAGRRHEDLGQLMQKIADDKLTGIEPLAPSAPGGVNGDDR